ncbi:response regulator [bacterium]|nr:response regulator [bacterium]MBU1958338.1 response regulator [bacterium]
MDDERVKRIINRERAARKESERLLESKSSELYEINQNLEKLVLERTNKLSNALKEAELAMKVKDEFLSNMSHEIRTPLNAIIGFVQIMMKSTYNEKSFFKHLSIVNSSSKNLLQIINDILDFSKLQSGKFTISLVNIDLKAKLEHTFSLFSQEAEAKSLYYELFFSDDFPKYLLVDETRIVQILSNFISNAIKFTPVGKVILVNVGYDHKTSKLKIEVQDTGIGIDEEAKAKIFNSFEQEDASVTRKFGGTGLGLAISKQLIELMDGTIIFESTKGSGSTFGFEMSVETGGDVEVIEEKSKEEEHGYKGKVLIAEDNEMSAILMETLMEGFEVEFEIVADGELAVEAVKSNDYAFVFMDNQMPKLSGIEATKCIRTFNTDIPIVALSANALKTEQEEFLSAGMNDTLSKPVNQEDLKLMLDKYLK